MPRFSLRRLMALTTLVACFLAAWLMVRNQLDLGMPLLEYLAALLGGIGAVLLLLHGAAALEPLLPAPGSLHAAEQRGGEIQTGLTAFLVPLFLAPLPTLGLGGVGMLVVSQWDGQFARSFSQMGLDLLALGFFILGAALTFTSLGTLLALNWGAPLGRWTVYLHGATLGALIAGFFTPLAVFHFALYGGFGLLLTAAGLGGGWWLARRGFAGELRRSRRWSARGGLLLALPAAAIPPALIQWGLIGGFDALRLALFAGAVGLLLGSLAGALSGAERRKPAPRSAESAGIPRSGAAGG